MLVAFLGSMCRHHQVQGAADLDLLLSLSTLTPLRGGVAGSRAGVGHLGRHLITKTCRKQDITPEKLTLHADRGSTMTFKKVALLLADRDNKLNKKVIHPTT